MTSKVIAAGRTVADTDPTNQEKCMQRIALVVILAALSVLSAIALWEHGYWGIFRHQLLNTAGLQVLADLGVALSLVMMWLWRDARQHGRNPWVWLLATLALGSFGPLIYLVTRSRPARSSTVADGAASLAGR